VSLSFELFACLSRPVSRRVGSRLAASGGVTLETSPPYARIAI